MGLPSRQVGKDVLMRPQGMKKSPPPNGFAVFTNVIYLKRSIGETNTGDQRHLHRIAGFVFGECDWPTWLAQWRQREGEREREGLWGTGIGAILARKLQITNHAEYKSVKLASD